MVQDIKKILSAQKEFFASGRSRTLEYRLNALKRLKEVLIRNEQQILSALETDLKKPLLESYTSEIGMIINEINNAMRHIKKWTRPEKVRSTLLVLPSRSLITKEPYGTALIIGPWNYPFQLTFSPLAGAIAAGNCCIVKPSELSVKSSEVISRIIREAFDENYVAAIEGDVEVSSILLEQKFDKIFFTGSPNVGKIVMEKAARHLTSVTLELGGKSPCIVDKGINFDVAAKRILWGKFLNAGQTCIAPDYILVHKEAKEALYNAFRKWLKVFFTESPESSPDFGKIINQKHFGRLLNYLQSGKIIIGGQSDESRRFIAPTVMEITDVTAPVMKEEIFGPILPVIEYSNSTEIARIIGLNPDPLGFYVFSRDKEFVNSLISDVSFGGGCVNDTISHTMNHHLPFGGRGNSGIGSYHGKYSFEAFTHRKAILKKGFAFDLAMKYPPYGNNHKFIRGFVMK
jgi:aldehyde dehydrogenase (NAD+)